MNDRQNKNLPFYFGPPLKRPFAAVLNSRQSKTPRGAERWVANTVAAVEYLAGNGITILSSLGTHPWNFLVWAVGHVGGNQIVVHPLYREDDPEAVVERIVADFDLESERTGFVLFETDYPINRPKLAWRDRDRAIFEMADMLFPVSVRPGGNFFNDIQRHTNPGTEIVRDFSCDYSPAKRRGIKPLERDGIESEFSAEKWNYITHWTHTFNGPFPGENSAKYYNAVANSGEAYCRTAFDSLQKILSDGQIQASGTHARKKTTFVSFTELPPTEAIKLMRWHRRDMRFTFEPYGVAIDKKIALEIGIRPVIYGQPADIERLPESDRPYFQPNGKKGDWTAEKEWRFIGNLDLSFIPDESMLVIVRKSTEAGRIRRDFNERVAVIEK